MIPIIGAIIVAIGVGIFFSGRIFSKRRDVLERYGIYVFFAGVGIWASTFAI
jgi:hypothetical protein